MKKSIGAKNLGISDTGLGRGDQRQGRQTQRDDRGLGWYLLFPAALCYRFVTQSHLFLRQYRGTKGLHPSMYRRSPCQGG